jgi:subtilisin family serine protease
VATARRRPSRVRGFHFTVALTGEPEEILATVERAVGQRAYRALRWQVTPTEDGSLVVALPETPPTTQRMGVLRAQLTAGTVELRSSPLETITNGPAEEPPSGRLMAAFEVQPAPPDDWYWPLAGRLPSAAYAGAPTIRIAHLDTGIGAHPSFVGRYDAAASINPVDFPTDPKGKGVICWPKPLPWDLVDHGTSTAAMIIGELTNNPVAAGGVSGLVPPGVAVLIPARVLSDGPVIGPFDVERVVAAIDWAVGEAHCQVISISIGYPIRDQRFEAAVQRAFAAGVIVCAAAGQIAPTIIWPAATAIGGWSVCCGGSTAARTPFPDSAWWAFPANYVTIAAPSAGMPKASWLNRDCSSATPSAWLSGGTSYAAPFVAGIAALWLARHWGAVSGLVPEAIVPRFRAILARTAIPWADAKIRSNPRYGPGIIDPRSVIESAP